MFKVMNPTQAYLGVVVWEMVDATSDRVPSISARLPHLASWLQAAGRAYRCGKKLTPEGLGNYEVQVVDADRFLWCSNGQVLSSLHWELFTVGSRQTWALRSQA